MVRNMDIHDTLSFKDKEAGGKHGLHGHVTIFREDPETKQLSLWDEDDNIIPISGYQWILMKMFNLYLDSKHTSDSDPMGKDTSVIIPDLNRTEQLGIGLDPSEYTNMEENIASNHFIQGFMVGNGASSEDLITAKNTDYSFIDLRNPIPFRQGDIPTEEQRMYLGKYRDSAVASYFIKKFEATPNIIHSWYRTGQAWNAFDPVTQADLGPNAQNGTPKTNRIETYANITMSISSEDFAAYFANNPTESAIINELGLVAFNMKSGHRTAIESTYRPYVKPIIDYIFSTPAAVGSMSVLKDMADEAKEAVETAMDGITETHIDAFISTLTFIIASYEAEVSYADIRQELIDRLSAATNIGVLAYYDQNQNYVSESDKFLEYVDAIQYSDTDEAERIKLITYYTFKAIPIDTNTRWFINYRIYAN